MLADPAATPVTVPSLLTVAIDGSLDVNEMAPVLFVSYSMDLVLPAETDKLSVTVRFVTAPVCVKKL